MSDKPRIYSLIATVVIVACIILWMMCDTLTLSLYNRTWPPRHDSEIIIDDEYAELLDLPVPKTISPTSKAYNETETDNKADAAPESGMETVDQGEPADAPEPVVQDKPSPVQTPKKDKPVKQGPSPEEIKRQQEEEEARRKATASTVNAFRNAGKNNTTNRGKTEGNAGSPEGSQSAVNGRSTGRVGGGWAMPKYNTVPSTVTGSVELMVKIDRQGNVKSVSFIGGDAPAATTPSVRAACEREVRARRFSRPDPDNAPEEATAYITYKFI